MTASSKNAIDLVAVVVACGEGAPRVMTLEAGAALPSGPLQTRQRSLQAGLREWVERQTRHPLGYLEQLYTFADRDRSPDRPSEGRNDRTVSISYLGLTREEKAAASGGPDGEEAPAKSAAVWRDWYDYFPWEDHRGGAPSALAAEIAPRLGEWARSADDTAARGAREERLAITFGLSGRDWNDELVLQRYELLFEAGLVPEAAADQASAGTLPGRAMDGDHRRILATGIARLRAKIKYRPVVFELMAPTFTLLQLQRCVEGLAGLPVHKQNFRRLVEQQNLVEETGEATRGTGGRPARLYRFRQAVLAERGVVGAKMPLVKP